MPHHPRDRQPRPSAEEIRAHLEAVNAQAKEVLGLIYQAMLKTPEITLQNGTKCRVEPYYGPEVDSGGELKCGVDVRMEDGSHLEFTVGHTGGGRPFAGPETKKTKPGRSR
jgi:hypothetical protein